MTIAPVATYRLQFRNGMTFDKAVEILPYLKRMGISHLYASPIFAATSGSTHGYDVVDYNCFDPQLGGESGFERLHQALRMQGMGLILDIVPNHMAASLENPWWHSVIALGTESPYANHFDIDWNRRLTLPFLGKPFEEALDAGEFTLAVDRQNNCPALVYFDAYYPLNPASYEMVSSRMPTLDAISAPEKFRWNKQVEKDLGALSLDRAFLNALHDQQSWKLTWWKEAKRDLSYRRFFEVTGLVGVRVENETVFEDVHALVLSLVRSGKVQGLRVDHVDGLARPGEYLRKLRTAIGSEPLLFVEKILGPGEALPADWGDGGTTGYEFIGAAADLLVNSEGLDVLHSEYDRFTGNATDIVAEQRSAKLLMLYRNFEGELERLVGLAGVNVADQGQIRTAIAEIIAGLDVYRTYGETGRLSEADLAKLGRATMIARRCGTASDFAIEHVLSLLTDPKKHAGADALMFRTLFQQLSGPVMAKAVEDTLFYRVNPLIALNEVGATPGVKAGDLTRFHQAIAHSLEQPASLAATATHDTKRGEDARARLYALSEAPELWHSAIGLYSGDSEVHEPAVRWMIGQMVFGALPAEGLASEADREAFETRLSQSVEKSLREAKLRTSWLTPDQAYEGRVMQFVRALFTKEMDEVRRQFFEILSPVLYAGQMNSLTQTLAKLTGPAVPDIYQGAERTDFSLVDPDNRRPVDFASYMSALERHECSDPESVPIADGSFKQWLISKVLQVRAQHPELFLRGKYVPLRVEGAAANHYVGWLREYGDAAALVVAPRHTLLREKRALADADAQIVLLAQASGFRNVLTGGITAEKERISVKELLGGLPVAFCLKIRSVAGSSAMN